MPAKAFDWIVTFFGSKGERIEVRASNDSEAANKALAKSAAGGNVKLYEEIQSIVRKNSAGDEYSI